MKKPVEIRNAKRDEIAPIVTLYNLQWAESENPLDMKMATNFFEGIDRNPNHNMCVAVVDDRIVGVFVLMFKKNETKGEACQGILENVAVHPKFQRRGIGKAMISYVVQECRRVGCKQVIHVSNEKRESAHSFYESLGFERHGFRFVLDVD